MWQACTEPARWASKVSRAWTGAEKRGWRCTTRSTLSLAGTTTSLLGSVKSVDPSSRARYLTGLGAGFRSSMDLVVVVPSVAPNSTVARGTICGRNM